MLFNSYEFILVFLPIMFFGYFFLVGRGLIIGSKVWLVVGSLVFYSWWNIIYLPLILLSISINYIVGVSFGKLEDKSSNEKIIFSKRTLLVFGVVFNLSFLIYFKYIDFIIVNINNVFSAEIEVKDLLLPLAISFFTFQQIAYLVDSYRNKTNSYNFIDYALFVTFFPQLIAGPIVHHKEMMPQFASQLNAVKSYRNIIVGLFVFSIGLFKKVMIADTFAQWANTGFDSTGSLNILEAWSTSLSYTFQLYFDFSGYADMAIGIALLFNIRLPINFNSPYKALNIQDFWRRWHMTLSRFLRDYVYIPIGGNRLSNYRTYINLFITFLIGGVWHGAGWMFIIWGSLHGAALIVHRLWAKFNFKVWCWLAWLITFNFINVTWIFFRASDFNSVVRVLKGMLDFRSISLPAVLNENIFLNLSSIEYNELLKGIDGTYRTFIYIFLAFIFISFKKNSSDIYIMNNVSYKQVFLASFFYTASFLSMLFVSSKEFLYFNF